MTRCFIAFAFSHTIGDGMVGLAFYCTFLDACQQTTGTDEKESFLVALPSRTLPGHFDTPERLPISWKFLLGPLITVYLTKFLAEIFGLRAAVSTVDAGTWTGSHIFFDPASAHNSKVKILEIEAPLIQNALQMPRTQDAKLTAKLHQLIIRALSKAIPNRDITNFVLGTAVDMRGSIGTPHYTWGLYVSGHYEAHPRLLDVGGVPLSDEMWAAASSMTRKVAECATKLQDQAIGLLRYVPSIRKWTLGKIGQRRDCSYEMSDLLAVDGGGADHKCKITKMMFTQPGNALSGPLVFNTVSVKGGQPDVHDNLASRGLGCAGRGDVVG